MFRDAPLLAPLSRTRIYAFDPWTKVPVIIRPAPTPQGRDKRILPAMSSMHLVELRFLLYTAGDIL